MIIKQEDKKIPFAKGLIKDKTAIDWIGGLLFVGVWLAMALINIYVWN